MMKTKQSEKVLDKQIAQTEAKLAELRKKKLVLLQSRLKDAERAMNELSSNLRAGAIGSGGKSGRKGRGGPRGPHLSDEEVMERLTRIVKAAGPDGISARSAAADAGVFYLRAIKAMDKNFKKTGVAKWTRYRLK